MTITIKRLSSGYFVIAGENSNDWTQVPSWPCSMETIARHAFAYATVEFIRRAFDLAKEHGWEDREKL
jgi:hypothetical protein